VSPLEISLGCVVAYLMAGAMKVTQDFLAAPLDRQYYVIKRQPIMTLFAWIFWWRRQSLLFFIIIMFACFGVVSLAARVIEFFVSNFLVSYGVPLAFVLWSMVLFLKRKAAP
jgi:hypothetical protein